MTTTKQTIHATYGSINLRAESMTISNWLLDQPFDKVSAVTSGRRSTSFNQFTQATNHRESGKGFYSNYVEHDSGSLILIEARGTRRGIRHLEAGLCLRLRPDAALIMVQANLPHDASSIIGRRVSVFQGNADILTPAEIRVLGFALTRGYEESFLDEEEVEDAFTIQTLAKERRRALSFITRTEGRKTEVMEVAGEPTRMLRRSVRRTVRS